MYYELFKDPPRTNNLGEREFDLSVALTVNEMVLDCPYAYDFLFLVFSGNLWPAV